MAILIFQVQLRIVVGCSRAGDPGCCKRFPFVKASRGDEVPEMLKSRGESKVLLSETLREVYIYIAYGGLGS